MKNLLNLLFPSVCNGCSALLTTNETTICAMCRHNLPLTNHLQIQHNETLAKFYGKLPVEYAASVAYFHKEGVLQHLIHNLKYKGAQDVGAYFGEFYAGEIRKFKRFDEAEIVIPVPLHPKKMKQRGYNQVTTFGKSLAETLGKEFNETVLHRTRYSKTQTKKNIFGRTEIGTEIFEARFTEALHGKHFLIVDDVITTGSTLEACGKALLKIPGAKVSIVTIGYAH